MRALFLDSITDPRMMERGATETGAAIGGTLYGDALSPPGGEADTYIRMLRHDIGTLEAGMLKMRILDQRKTAIRACAFRRQHARS